MESSLRSARGVAHTVRAFVFVLLHGLVVSVPSFALAVPFSYCHDFHEQLPCPLPGDDLVLATVNGVELTGVDLRFTNHAGVHRRALPSEQPPAEAMKRALLEDAIDAELLYQEAVRQGALDDPEVQDLLMSQVDVERFARPANEMEVSDEELEAYRASHPEEFVLVAYRHVQHRVFRVAGECPEEDARREAEAFRAAFPVDRRAFDASLGQETPCALGGLDGAYLVLREGAQDAGGLAEVAWGLEYGEVSEVVRLADGFHVLKRIGGNDRRTVTLETGRGTIRSALNHERARAWRAEAAALPRTWFEIEIDEPVLARYRIGQGLSTEVVATVADLEITTAQLDVELVRLAHRWEEQGRAPGEQEVRARLEEQIDLRVLFLAHRDEFLAKRRQGRTVARNWLWRRELPREPCVEPEGGFDEALLRQAWDEHVRRFSRDRVVSVDRLPIVAEPGERPEALRRRAEQLRGEVAADWDQALIHDARRIDRLYPEGFSSAWLCEGGRPTLVPLSDAEREAARSLEPGEVSALLETGDGFAVLRGASVAEGRWPTFEEQLERGRESLVNAICQERYDQQVYRPYLDRLRADAVIEIDAAALECYEALPLPPWGGCELRW